MLLVNILILAQEEETLNLKKLEKSLKPQNKVAFVTTHRRSGITTYDNKLPPDSSTFLDAEAKVWETYGSGFYVVSGYLLSISELK